MTRTFYRVFRSLKRMHIFSRERDNLSLFCDVNCMNCTQCTRDAAPPQRAVTEVTGPIEVVQFLHVFSLCYFRPCENWRLQITEERISLIWKGEQWLRRGEKKIGKPRWKEMFQPQWLVSFYFLPDTFAHVISPTSSKKWATRKKMYETRFQE